MIDIENQIYSRLADELETKVPSIKVFNQHQFETATFPVVTIVELNNVAVGVSSFNKEVTSRISYEVKIYSNKEGVGYIEAKQIAHLVNNYLTSLGFTREMIQPIPNYSDTGIYQIVARFSAVVDTAYRTYRR